MTAEEKLTELARYRLSQAEETYGELQVGMKRPSPQPSTTYSSDRGFSIRFEASSISRPTILPSLS